MSKNENKPTHRVPEFFFLRRLTNESFVEQAFNSVFLISISKRIEISARPTTVTHRCDRRVKLAGCVALVLLLQCGRKT